MNSELEITVQGRQLWVRGPDELEGYIGRLWSNTMMIIRRWLWTRGGLGGEYR